MTARLVTVIIVCSAFALLFVGCNAANDVGEFAGSPLHQTPHETDKLNHGYETTELGISNSAEVLANIRNSPRELVSQSESVIAAWRQDPDKDDRTWFNMVAFDEEALTAMRKYFVFVYDRPSEWFVLKEKFRFDAEIVFDQGFMDEPFADENSRRIAILRKVLETYSEDVSAVEADNQKMADTSLVANQTIYGILAKLKMSPAFASRLDDREGLEFDQINLGDGKIRMLTNGNIVRVKIKAGTITRSWMQQQDVNEMDANWPVVY
jgi:hypothetical protein